MQAVQTGEEWRDIPGWQGIYQVSSEGRVRSCDRWVACKGDKKRRISGQVLTPYVSNGYPSVRLSNGKASFALVHVLVCRAFHGDRPTAQHQVAHNDGNRANNRFQNVRWATAAENAADRILHGTERRGQELTHLSKLDEAAVADIRARYVKQYGVLTELARHYGVTPTAIQSIVKRKNWKHV